MQTHDVVLKTDLIVWEDNIPSHEIAIMGIGEAEYLQKKVMVCSRTQTCNFQMVGLQIQGSEYAFNIFGAWELLIVYEWAYLKAQLFPPLLICTDFREFVQITTGKFLLKAYASEYF